MPGGGWERAGEADKMLHNSSGNVASLKTSAFYFLSFSMALNKRCPLLSF